MPVPKPDLRNNPGFLFRRLQQVSVSLFLDRLRQFGITPLQYTILRIIEGQPGIDQISVASQGVLDASTVKDIIERLETKKLVERRTAKHDHRSRAVFLTPAGSKLLAAAEPFVQKARKELLSPLSKQKQATVLRAMRELLEAHEHPSDKLQSARPWHRLRQAS